MAELVDLSGNNATIKLLSSPNRTINSSPIGVLTPQFPGELIADTLNGIKWRAFGPTSSDWMPTKSFGIGETSPPPEPDELTSQQQRLVRATQGLIDAITVPPTDNSFMRAARAGTYRSDLVA